MDVRATTSRTTAEPARRTTETARTTVSTATADKETSASAATAASASKRVEPVQATKTDTKAHETKASSGSATRGKVLDISV